MSHTLKIPDSLHDRLVSSVNKRGLSSIEELLEVWQAEEDELRQRREVVDQINALRARLLATYGEMSDSVALLREDRSR